MDQYLKVFWAYNNRRRLSLELSDYLQQHALCFILKARENLIGRGENPDTWCFNKKGIIRYYTLLKKENFTCRFRTQSEFMVFDNDAWEKRHGPYEIGVDAVTDAVLWSIPREVIRTVQQLFPEFTKPYTNAICNEWKDSSDLSWPREYKSIRYNVLLQLYGKLLHRIPVGDLASFVCTDAKQLEVMLPGKTKTKLPFFVPLSVNRGGIRRW